MTDAVLSMEVALTKVRLGPGDTLFLSAPDGWTVQECAAFQGWVEKILDDKGIKGVCVLMISELMKVFVHDSRIGATEQ
jgi:hypothetical protein